MVTGTLPDEGVLLEHQDRRYRVEPMRPQAALAEGSPIEAADALWHRQWAVRDEQGRAIGTLAVIAQEGEGGDPVYGGILPGERDTLLEGSDWVGIVLGLANETEGRGVHSLEPRG